MSSRSLAALSFTILGLYSLLNVVLMLGSAAAMAQVVKDSGGSMLVTVAAYFFVMGLMAVAGVALILLRFRLADWVCGEEAGGGPAQPLHELPDIVFAGIGLFAAISSLPGLGALAGQLIQSASSSTLDDPAHLHRRVQLVEYMGTLAKLVVGTYLFMYAPKVSSWWRGRGSEGAVEPAEIEYLCPQCEQPFDPQEYCDDGGPRLCSACHTVLPDIHFE